VLRSRSVRILLDSAGQSIAEKERSDNDDDAKFLLVDRLIWDDPNKLDLLGLRNETKKSKALDRNVQRLYKNDARFAYLAQATLSSGEHVSNDEKRAVTGEAVLASFKKQPYFDYFAAYHVFKTLGWLRYAPAAELLLDQFNTLPPRFFNHKLGAGLALALIGHEDVLPAYKRVALSTRIWELKYACLIGSCILGDPLGLREQLAATDSDPLIRGRAQSHLNFEHLL